MIPNNGSGPGITAMAQRREEIARRYLQGQYQSQIARDMGITQSAVSLALKKIRAEWLASSLRNFDALQAEQLAKIDLVEVAAWEGWARSLLPREVSVTEATEGKAQPTVRKASLRREGQAGDPRFLVCVQKCIDQRIGILGLGAEQEALQQAAQGISVVLEQARQLAAKPVATSPTPPMAEA